jgi:quercetin dioxygenase-like cupin family protein
MSIMMRTAELSTLKPYKRSPDLSNSTWYKGLLVSQLAGPDDRAFDILLVKHKRGAEPPPHIHSREDEFINVISGEANVYVDHQVFRLTAGDCLFMPRQVAHAVVTTSEELQVMVFIAPGGFLGAVNKMNAPAERMEIPGNSDAESYANTDLTETFKIFDQFGVRFLTEDEIRTEMPDYPHQPA